MPAGKMSTSYYQMMEEGEQNKLTWIYTQLFKFQVIACGLSSWMII